MILIQLWAVFFWRIKAEASCLFTILLMAKAAFPFSCSLSIQSSCASGVHISPPPPRLTSWLTELSTLGATVSSSCPTRVIVHVETLLLYIVLALMTRPRICTSTYSFVNFYRTPLIKSGTLWVPLFEAFWFSCHQFGLTLPGLLSITHTRNTHSMGSTAINLPADQNGSF